jgi:hypothetical protein
LTFKSCKENGDEEKNKGSTVRGELLSAFAMDENEKLLRFIVFQMTPKHFEFGKQDPIRLRISSYSSEKKILILSACLERIEILCRQHEYTKEAQVGTGWEAPIWTNQLDSLLSNLLS